MENKSKLRSVLSWADEVDKEEQEEAAERECRNQKTNPFGSAKPREVVLQERGIDWRYLDQHLHISSSLRNEPGKMKKMPLKENVYVPARVNMVEKQTFFRTRGPPEQVRRGDNRLVQYGSELGEDVPGRFSSESVPPLKYPPKAYVNGVYIQNYVHSPLPLQTWQLKSMQEPITHWDQQGSRAYQDMSMVGGKNMDAKDSNGQLIKTPHDNKKFGKQFTNQDSDNCVVRCQSKWQKNEAARGQRKNYW